MMIYLYLYFLHYWIHLLQTLKYYQTNWQPIGFYWFIYVKFLNLIRFDLFCFAKVKFKYPFLHLFLWVLLSFFDSNLPFPTFDLDFIDILLSFIPKWYGMCSSWWYCVFCFHSSLINLFFIPPFPLPIT